MILCIDVGNTHIFSGVFSNDKIKLRFRYPSKSPCTSDLFGIFLINLLRENNIEKSQITGVCLSSVVPSLDYSIHAACKKYFSLTPIELKPGIKTGLNLDIKNPLELGADRIATSVAAAHQLPNKNIIIIDFGTATTLCVISKERVYRGGAILPGFKTSMESLFQNTAKLPSVEILKPTTALGKTTIAQIQAGIYYGQLGALKEIIHHYKAEIFGRDKVVVLATGGYAQLFEKEKLFNLNVPDLVLNGLYLIWKKNNPKP